MALEEINDKETVINKRELTVIRPFVWQFPKQSVST